MAGRPKTRAKMEAAARELGMTYEEYMALKRSGAELPKPKTDSASPSPAPKEKKDTPKTEEEERKATAKSMRDSVRMKRADLSDWITTFVSGNMKKYGQQILDSLVSEDPKEASRFLANIMKFAAPTVADPEKLEANKKEEKKKNPDYKEAQDKINKLKKQFEKK